MTFEPDPLRDHFSRGARLVLDRAYRAGGGGVSTRLADPDAAAIAACLQAGINPLGPDNPSAAAGRRGGLNARTRWMRAFIRCLYEEHLWWAETHGPAAAGGRWRGDRRLVPLRSKGLIIDVGSHVPALGVIPAGRRVKIRVVAGAQRAARKEPAADRIYDDAGVPAARWSDPALRDWR